MTTTKKKTTKKKATTKKAPAKKKTDVHAAFRDFMKGDKSVELLTLADDDVLSNVKGYISTQSVALNKALKSPGIPQGRLIEISGDEHTGKSTLTDHLLAEVQSMGGVGILMDPEIGRDARYTRSIGVDPEKLHTPQPAEGSLFTLQWVFKQIGRVCDHFKASAADGPVLIVVDSLAGLPTDEDTVRDAGEVKPGDAAKVIRHALRNIIPRLAQSGITLVLVNQLYDNIGGFGYDQRKEYGGRGPRYAASVRIRLNRAGQIQRNGVVVGNEIQAHIRKSKVEGVTGAKVKFAILHGRGIDNTWSIFQALKEERPAYITGAGAWFKMQLPDGEELKWTGQHWGLAEKFTEDPKLYEWCYQVYMQCVAT